MAAIEVRRVSHRYGRREALRDVSFDVPSGSICALLGPNGAGKTTLLRIVAGLLGATSGETRLLGLRTSSLTPAHRMRIGYIAEGQELPRELRLRELEAYLAPLYDGWDHALADELRQRFRLDPSRRVRTLSRGEQMKAAVLVALAPRPEVLVMDEPFSGMDVLVKDELVRGLLATVAEQGTTVLISSHDLGELEMLIDHVAFLNEGTLLLTEPMESLRSRFVHVEVVVQPGGAAVQVPAGALERQTTALRTTFIVVDPQPGLEEGLRRAHDGARVSVRSATLREVFVALARRPAVPATQEAA